MTGTPPLNGVRVLELGGGKGYAIPYATRLLADLGAEVVVVEPPGGHELRTSGGSFQNDPAVAAHVFDFLMRGKRSATLDLDNSTEGVLRALASSSHVIVDGLDIGALATLGLDDADLLVMGTKPVVVHVSEWGASGPYRDRPATGLVLQAAAGWVSTRQEPGLPPVQVGGQMHEWVAGSYIAAAVMTARTQAGRTGQGVAVDFSLFECIHASLPSLRLMADTTAELDRGSPSTTLIPFGIRPCKDGWVGINILTAQQWKDACFLMELRDFADRQDELTAGVGDVEGFERRLINWLSSRTVDEVVELGQALRIPVVPVATGGTVTASAQWTARGFFEEYVTETSASSRSVVEPGPPWRLHRTSAVRARPPPLLGGDNDGLLDCGAGSVTEGE